MVEYGTIPRIALWTLRGASIFTVALSLSLTYDGRRTRPTEFWASVASGLVALYGLSPSFPLRKTTYAFIIILFVLILLNEHLVLTDVEAERAQLVATQAVAWIASVFWHFRSDSRENSVNSSPAEESTWMRQLDEEERKFLTSNTSYGAFSKQNRAGLALSVSKRGGVDVAENFNESDARSSPPSESEYAAMFKKHSLGSDNPEA